MLKDIAKKYYLENGYNCAESIIRAGNDYYHLGLHDHDMIMVAALGGGMQCGELCGAITGGACVLSSKYVEKKAHESSTITKVTVQMLKRFEKKMGARYCRDLRKKYFKKENRCLFSVEVACDVLEEVINEYNNKGGERNEA